MQNNSCNSCRKLSRVEKINDRKLRYLYASPANISSFSKPLNRTPYASSRGQVSSGILSLNFKYAVFLTLFFSIFSVSTSHAPRRLSNAESFYSTFHDTPGQRKFSEAEWDKFSRESIRQALEGLVSSPDFCKWAVAHADRITLAPKKEVENKNRR